MARNSNAMLNRSGESGHACLVSAFSEAFNFPSSIMLAVRLSYIAFVVLRYVPFVPTLVRVSTLNKFSNDFFAAIDKRIINHLMIMCFFVFSFVDVVVSH